MSNPLSLPPVALGNVVPRALAIPRSLLALLTLALAATLTLPATAATLTRTSAFTYETGTGLLKKEIIEPGSSDLCLVTEYVYDDYGNKTSATTRNCDASAIPGIGNEAAAPAAGSDAVIASRTSSNDYATGTGWVAGQFPTKSTNALGQFETKTYDAKFGAVLTLTGPNDLATSWAYDGFGRKTLEIRADDTRTQWEYKYCTSISGGTENCPTIGGAAGAWVLITTPLASDGNTAIGPISKTYYDGLNREIRKETEGFDGTGTSTAVYQDTRYDSLGRAYQKSRPYYGPACSEETTCWTKITYDSLGRVYQENRPDETIATGALTTYAYEGLSVTVTNSKGQTRKTKKNSQGQVVEVTDAADKKLTFAYDAFGNLTQTKDALNNVTTLTYDDRGRKKTMQDPDMGSWSYDYNALGQLIRQTDAKAQVSTMEYDLLGRMTRRNEVGLTSYWYYDTGKNGAACPKGIGKLCQAETDTGYFRTHSYDSLGRPSSTSTTVDDIPYVTSVTYGASDSPPYNRQGRVIAQTYPSGLVVYYGYTAKGYLKELRKDNETGPYYWQAIEQDAEGHLREQKFGNDVVTTQTYAVSSGRLTGILSGAGSVQDLTYEYDSLGNVTHRRDIHPNLTTPAGNVTVDETFLYDTLNRLDSSTVTSSAGSTTIGSASKTYTYDTLGNITSRSDVSVSAANNGYVYPASGVGSVGPHAVSRVNLLGGGHRTYEYDLNGNLAHSTQYSGAIAEEAYRVSGGGRTAHFTSFNMPSVVHDDHATTIRLELSLYGPEHQRLKGSVTKPVGTGTEVVSRTTIYLHPDNSGGLAFEKETQFDGTVEERNFITAGGQVVAVVKRVNGTWNPPQYFHRDNLGSTTAITDHNGIVIERLAYEPFGKRRFSDGITAGTDDTGNTIAPLNTTRGFTNHEHIDELGFVHMNGRIYDPAIGRFLSADFVNQDPMDLQAYNRYAYVRNNPLRYTDPNGQVFGEIFEIVMWVIGGAEAAHQLGIIDTGTTRMIQGVAVAAALGSPAGSSFLGGLTGASQAMVAGFAGGFVGSNFNVEAGIIGGLTAGAFNLVGTNLTGPFEKILGHAAVGCASSSLSGGDCGSGALSAGFGAAAHHFMPEGFKNDPFLRGAYVAVVGGTASVVGGGKFANGAQTAAFGYLFNWLAHIHEALTLSAAQQVGLSDAAGSNLAKRVSGVDFEGKKTGIWPWEVESQDTAHAHMHAMCSPGSSTCRSDFQSYVAREIGRGTIDGLARAIHAYQDLYAPGHQFKTYSGSVGPEHFLGDGAIDLKTIKGITNVTSNIIRNFQERFPGVLR